MENHQLKTLCEQSCLIIADVAAFIQKELGKVETGEIETKALNSLVSYVDKQAEIQLVDGLGRLIPNCTFLTEEETVEQTDGEYRWIIDPLDGTTNFLHQLPFFSVSVALQRNQETIMGIVYEVNRKECFYAWKGGGAFLNKLPISTTTTAQMADSLMATGFPYYDYSQTKAYLVVLEKMMRGSRGIRRLGSAALDLAYVACGRFDAYFEYSLNAWDIAAGAFIVQESGGTVSDFDGQKGYLDNGEIVAAGKNLYPEIIQIVQEAFKGGK